MKNKMKALSLAIVAGLIMGPIAVNAAYAEDVVPVDPAAVTEVVEETVAEEPAVEPEAEPQEEAVIEEPKAVEEKAPSVKQAAAPQEQKVEEVDAPVVLGTLGDVQPWSQETNHVDYWEAYFADHEASCYKSEGNTAHGSITDGGKTVTLNAFDPSWPGDHWEALIVKGGSVSNNVIVHPDAGVAYASPVNDGGQQSNVSHWIVCKGTAPSEEPHVVVNNCTPQAGTHSTNLNDLWQNVDTRSAGHLEYVEDGLHIWTDDNSSQAKVSEGMAVNFPLHDTGVIDIQWTGSTPPPGVNLFVNFGADGNGTLVYESVYGQDLWLTNGSSAAVKANAPVNGGGNGSQWHGTIDQWLTKYPDATVTGIAYSLGSGVLGDGVITSITVGCATHTFDYVAPPTYEPSCTTVTGAQTIIGDGVLTVDGGWDTDSIDVPFSGTLADIGTVLDIDASPLKYVGLHIDTPEGTIVFEEEESYAGNLWSESAWDGVEAGMGYAAFGSIEQFIHLNGDVEVTGIRLLYTHPEASSTTVTSFTIGCTVYTFEPMAEKPEPVVESKTESVTDCYQSTITYQDFTRTTGEPTYNAEDNAWTQGEFGPWVESGEPRVTPATAEECPLPEDEVTTGEWTYTVNCNTEVGSDVPATREVTTVTYAYNEQGEVVSASSTATEKGTHVVTEADVEALDCPVVVDEPDKPAPAKAPLARSLPATGGGDVSPLVPLVSALTAALGIGLVAFAAIRRRTQV